MKAVKQIFAMSQEEREEYLAEIHAEAAEDNPELDTQLEQVEEQARELRLKLKRLEEQARKRGSGDL